MNQPSVFQGQYPLSPRKFWKKVIPKFIVLLIPCVTLFILQIAFIGQQDAGIINVVFGVFYGVVILYLVLYSFYIRVYIKRYYYDCGDQFVTIKKGVFAPTEIHVQYQKIQDVYVDQDILDRIMGLYDVHIASATVTSGIEAHIDGVNGEVAENLKNIILGKIHGASNPSTNTQTPASQPQANPVQFSQKISSETYLISKSWIYSAIVSSIFFSLIWSFLIVVGGLDYLAFHSIPIFSVCLLLLFLIIFFLRIIYLSIWKKNYYFEFMPEYILLRTGVISRSENHLPYKSIQNVLNQQGIFDRMFGLSKVVIQNAAQQAVSSRGQAIGQGSAISLVWQPKAKAEELNNILNDIVSKINPQNSSNMMGL